MRCGAIEVDRRSRASHCCCVIRPSVLSRVMPALWTTMSTPPCAPSRCEAISAGASSSVMSAINEEPPIRPVTTSRSAASAGTSSPTTCAPSRARTSAIASPIPREAPVTSATLPASGRSGIELLAHPDRQAPIRTTCPETYADLRREEEAQRRLDTPLGLGRDVDQLGGRALAHLLADRAHEALERPLGDRRRRRRAVLGGRAEHDHAPAAAHAPDRRMEELERLAQLRRSSRSRWRRGRAP